MRVCNVFEWCRLGRVKGVELNRKSPFLKGPHLGSLKYLISILTILPKVGLDWGQVGPRLCVANVSENVLTGLLFHFSNIENSFFVPHSVTSVIESSW